MQADNVITLINHSTFARHFFSRLPRMVQNDVKRKIKARKERQNANKSNMQQATDDAMKWGKKTRVNA